MKVLTSLDELDRQIVRLDDLNAKSDADLRKGFEEFCMELPVATNTDPDSEAYRSFQMDLYHRIAGKPYSPDNEVTVFDVAKSALRPFPYTNGYEVIADQLIAIGLVVKRMKLAPGAEVLEFGPGWGNTTIALARAGYNVTCIEIEKHFVELILARASQKSLNINAIHGDFFAAKDLSKQYDAVLFFECFHHCSRHNDLFDLLDRLVTPDGIAVFAAEPITDDFPVPWGLRSDGQTLWAVRKFGWMELGFQESYFRSCLAKRGWNVEKTTCDATSIGTIFIARRQSGATEQTAAPTIALDADDSANLTAETINDGSTTGIFRMIVRTITPIAMRNAIRDYLRRI